MHSDITPLIQYLLHCSIVSRKNQNQDARSLQQVQLESPGRQDEEWQSDLAQQATSPYSTDGT